MIDIAPTLLDLAGLKLHDGIEGRNLLEERTETPVYSESLVAQRKLGLHPLFAHSDEDGRFLAGKYDSFYPFNGEDISTTPAESEKLVEMIQKLEAYVALAEENEATTSPMDAETLQQLAALGYMGGVVDGTTIDVDPRDVIDIIPLTWQIRFMLSKGQLKKAEEMFAVLEEKMGIVLGS